MSIFSAEDNCVALAEGANEWYGITSDISFVTTNPDELSNIVTAMELVEPVMVGMGLALLSLVIMLEFYNIAQQQQMHQGIPGIEIMFGVLLKFICGILVVRYGMDLAGGMYAIGNSIAEWMMTAFGMSTDIGSSIEMIDIASITTAEDGSDIELDTADVFLYGVIYVMAMVQVFVVAFVSVTRLFKGVFMITFAPLALVAFFGSETKQMGIGFIRNMLALAIQGAIIVFSLYLFPVFMTEISTYLSFGNTSAFFASLIMKVVLCGTIITTITKSSTIAKELVGA